MQRASTIATLVWLIALVMNVTPQAEQPLVPRPAPHANVLFKTADTCMACHNGLTTSAGEDISIGTDWRGSIMAHSSRDPYWQAAVRRETIDHPQAAAEIEDECAVCHMPMARAEANARGRTAEVFARLPVNERGEAADLLAYDGVSCAMCHQISSQKLGTPESFSGGFVLDVTKADDPPAVFGPFEIDSGRRRIMQSSAGFLPTESVHMRQSELCATCHTLYTNALGPQGEVVGRLAEQVPYLEWRHSAFPTEEQTCQSCHMPVVREETAITSVLGTPRQGVARHVFRGGNFFMLRMLHRYRAELGVKALPQELDAAARWTEQQLQSETAAISIDRAVVAGGRLEADVTVRNLAGHKLPTGYPSRRVWLELIVTDGAGRAVFQSGGVSASGLIEGNDNDADATQFEPHYAEIRRADEVQIYESMMVDSAGAVTTGQLKSVRYIKDNRLLPRGFDKSTASADIAVLGAAAPDPDFLGGADRIRYTIDLADAAGPYTVEATLRFQPIAYRWAQNLKPYDAVETRRFVAYYESMSAAATAVLARATASAGDRF
ncbi:MAG: hypothetical protein ABR606_02180 [Vicinamibacterales bacterium]